MRVLMTAAMMAAFLFVMPAHAQQKPISLVWHFAAMTAQGPAQGSVPENTRFDTFGDCEEFGDAMQPRIEDWIRGYGRLDWDAPVHAEAECRQDST